MPLGDLIAYYISTNPKFIEDYSSNKILNKVEPFRLRESDKNGEKQKKRE
jgi:hypothetical protein